MGGDDGGNVVEWETIEAALKGFQVAMADACETRAGDPLLGSAKATMACVELIEALPPMWNAGHAAPLYELALALHERHRTGQKKPSRVLDPPPDSDRNRKQQQAASSSHPAAREVIMGMAMTVVRALMEPGQGCHTLDEACRVVDGCIVPYRTVIRPSGGGVHRPRDHQAMVGARFWRARPVEQGSGNPLSDVLGAVRQKLARSRYQKSPCPRG